MKKLLTAIALTSVLAAPAFAGSDNHHQHESNMSSSQTQMHDHVQMMKKLMADIKREKDPKKQHQMMQKHMQSMQTGMHMISSGDMSSVKLDTRMGLMEERINMMQAIMVQMLEYSDQAEARAFEESLLEGGLNR